MSCPCQQDESANEKETPPPAPPHFYVHSFCKTLTASDTSTYGGFLVLRHYADECLPPLTCPGNLLPRSWWPKICMEMSRVVEIEATKKDKMKEKVKKIIASNCVL